MLDDSYNLIKFLYTNVNNSMKYALDMGTLLSNDPQKLRAFKEQVKKKSREQWDAIGRVLEGLGLAEKCTFCKKGEFCHHCGGARYVTSVLLDSPTFTESGIAVTATKPDDIEKMIKHLTKQNQSANEQVPQV